MSDRPDPILGDVRRCRVCSEEWPLTSEFYERMGQQRGRRLMSTCRACRAERTARIRPTKSDTLYRRVRKSGPEGEALRARQREASKRYYWNHRAEELEKQRAQYAAKLDRPVRVGFGRPRAIAA